MIPIAFESNKFSLPKQYPSEIDGLEEDEVDSSKLFPEECDTLLPSFQRKKKNEQ